MPDVPSTQPPAPGEAVPPDLPPELAAHPQYEVIRELGRGGMGVVYLARNKLMDRYEVLKVMSKALVGKPAAVERFLQEIRSAGRLVHANVATAYSAHRLGDLLVLAMEYVEGDDLGKVVDVGGALPVAHACYYAYQAARGLQAGYELGLVHRDVKPSNLILSRRGRRATVKVIDFGLAKAKSEASVEPGLTATNQTMGTVGYSAPEQLNDAKNADTRSDIYALGCTLYHLLAGRPPFRGKSTYAIILAQAAGRVRPLREPRPEVPEGLAAVVARMMNRNPAGRFAEPAEAAWALIPFVKEGTGKCPGRPETPGPAVVRRPSPLDCTGPDGVSAADVRKAQEAWARYLGRQVEETIQIADGVEMTFVLVPPGRFRMGSPDGEKDRSNDETLHTVVLTEPFDLGKTEVTQAQFEALTGKNPSEFKGSDLPVEHVSWEEARDFGVKLTDKRSDKRVYRLPTEAEWEYSCRGGRPSSQPFGIGDGRSLSSREANFNGNEPYGDADKGPWLLETSPVGSYQANALGLFDMHGNVWEWCADRYGPYPDGELTNPTGPTEGSRRVNRGGGSALSGWYCRAALRYCLVPVSRSGNLGFRLARSVPSGGK